MRLNSVCKAGLTSVAEFPGRGHLARAPVLLHEGKQIFLDVFEIVPVPVGLLGMRHDQTQALRDGRKAAMFQDSIH
ncbi:MAG TPA: hypothetical protein VKI65_19200, partial [Gemmataceae bacterium]|nr:hypothetical protein [Gemmataceae bacterium]